jgi:rifampin ADP-ribosylating transferase
LREQPSGGEYSGPEVGFGRRCSLSFIIISLKSITGRISTGPNLIRPGYGSNYGKRKKAAYIYLTGTLNAAIWGAELALGEGPGRIYVVETTGPFEDDPNLTDKKYPDNATLSYRSKSPLRDLGEVANWQGHSADELKAMKDGIERAKQLGVEAIED